MSRRMFVLAATTLVIAGCQKMETPEQATARMQTEGAAARSGIEAQNAAYMRYLNANQGDSIALLFVDNGVMMPPNMPAVTGHDAIRAFMRTNPMPPGSQITFQTVSLTANGPIAIERGSYAFTMPNPRRGQPAVTMNGKYLVHWYRVGDTWKQVEAIWSDDAPMQAPGGN